MSSFDFVSDSCSTNRRRRWNRFRFHAIASSSLSGVTDDTINVSPQISHHNPIIRLERRQENWSPGHRSTAYNASTEISLPKIASQMKVPRQSSTSSIASNNIPLQQTNAELEENIAHLEQEVIQLERFLLSKYQKAFKQYLASPATITNYNFRSLSGYHSESQVQDTDCRIRHQATCAADSSYLGNKDMLKKAVTGRRSLADHLGVSIKDHVPDGH